MKVTELRVALQALEAEHGGNVQVVSVQKSPGDTTDERVVIDAFTATGTPCVCIVLEDREIT